jgi:tRNA(fMet)-specific endonuclease VapC
MPRLYLLDTNTASYIIKGNKPRVRERLVHVPMDRVAISVITEAELRFGLKKKPEAKKLRVIVEEFLLGVNILAWNSDSAKAYAALRFSMESLGKSMANLDLMIAAQAIAVQAVLVTSGAAFKKVNDLEVEDWTK